MELQLKTAEAEKRLASLEKALDSLQAKLTGFSSGAAGGFTTFTNSLQQLQAVPSSVATTIAQLSKAASGFQNAGNISTFANNLSKLQGIDLGGVAKQVQTLVTDLARLKTPPNMSKFVQDLRSVGAAANFAAAGLNAYNRASHNVKGIPTLPKVKKDLDAVTTSANSAGKATAYFGTMAGNLRAGLAAVGIAAVGRELGQFVMGAYEAQTAYDKFNAVMNNVTGAGTAAAQFDFLRKVSTETATSLEANMEAYSKFAQASIAAGFSAKDTADMFRNSAIAVRGFGLSGENAKGAMLALQQMMTKGKITAEEMNQQLAERGVPAMAALATATGKTTDELTKMMAAGQLGRTELQMMINEMGKMALPSLQEQLGKVGAQMQLMANNWTLAKLAFADNFFPAITAGLQALNAAFGSTAGITFFQTLGAVAGSVINVILMLFAALTNVVIGMVNTWYVFGAGVAEAWRILSESNIGWLVGELNNLLGFSSAAANALQYLGTVVGVLVPIFIGYKAAVLAVAAAKAIWLVVNTPIVLGVIALAAALGVASPAVREMARELVQGTKAAAEKAAALGKLNGSAEDAAAGLVNLKTQTENSTTAMNNASTAAQITDTSLSGMAAQTGNAANIFDELAGSANSAASAIQNVNSAAASAPSGGGGGGGGGGGSSGDSIWNDNPWDGSSSGIGTKSKMWDELGTWRDGGIVSEGSRMTRSLPASAFIGAPRFATGGTTVGMPGSLPDGGIPSILHPNEAVIPLASGSVPVQLSGSGSGGSGSALLTETRRGFSKLNSVMIEVSKHAAAIKEQINQTGVVYKSESDRHVAIMNTQTGLLTDMVTKIEAMRSDLNAMKSSGGGSGGGSSGGGSYSGGSASNANWTDQDEKDYQEAKAQYEKAKKLSGSFTQGNSMSKGFNAKGYSQAVNDKLANEFGGSKGGWGGSFGGSGLNMNYTSDGYGKVQGANSGSMLGDYFEKQLANNPAALGGGWSGATGGGFGMSSGFAKGSPNVFEEAQGRSAIVRIHPDEAVVPLPDGRSIPVDFGGMNMAHGGAGGGGRGDTNINIVVNAKDADSFRASEDQILQRMQQKLNRAVKNLGDAPIVDDPTVRPGSR